MPYVERTVGVISCVFACAQPGFAEEWVADDNAELLAYQNPQPAFAALRSAEIAKYKDMREKMFARVTNIGQRLSAAGDTEGSSSCVAVANSLLGLFTDAAVVAATDIVTLRAALTARYDQAAALASASARLEFKRYDK